MKKQTAISFLVVLLSVATFHDVIAQLRTYSTVGRHIKGTVTLESGEKIDGFIYIDMLNPQLFQKRVLIVTDEANAAFTDWEEAQKNQLKYDASDVKEFSLENGKKYKKAKYVNLFAKRKQDRIPKKLLLEVVTEGKITVFKKVSPHPGYSDTSLT